LILSIITVVKNDHKRLLKTIASLASYYSDSNYEHIIIDGISTDLTLDFIRQLSSKENVKILRESDDGIYDAMNKGIRLASGKYLLFLNAGDCMLENNEELHSLLEAVPRNIDIVCFPSRLKNGDKTVSLMPESFPRHKMPTSHQAMLFSKKFVAVNLYNPEYKVAGDFDLYLRANVSNLLIHPTNRFLTEIELLGYASENSTLAYGEYLKIVYHRLTGISRLLSLTRIFIWALIVILSKKFLSKKILSTLRKMT
jgi:putative colanic acid biosynthesis glycosyltransferase